MRTWFIPLLTSLGVSLALVPLVRALARNVGAVVQHPAEAGPRPPTVLFGGVGIALTVLGCSAAFNGLGAMPVVLGCGLLVFFLGLADEVVGLQPTTKLAAQIALASAFLFFQHRLDWTHSVTLDSFLTVLWIVGITNAVNRLDSVDGRCGGVALVATAGTVITLSSAGPGTPDYMAARHAAILLGAIGGFLVYNVSPASIFLGDSGGLFIGLNLAALALEPAASPLGIPSASEARLNLVPIAIAPVLAVMLVPILDSGLLTVWRASSGRSAPGGPGRVPHRLLGIRPSRRQAVLVLWALGAAVTAVIVVTQQFADSRLAVLGAGVLVVAMTVTIVLAGVGVDDEPEVPRNQRHITPLVIEPFYTRRAAEVMVDACLALVAYWGAYRLRYPDPAEFLGMFSYFLTSLPIVLAAQVAALFAVGTYRGRWSLFGLIDAATFGKAVLLGVVSAQLALLYVYRFGNYPRSVFAVYAVLAFLLLTGSRASFLLVVLYIRGRRETALPATPDDTTSAGTRPGRRVVRIITRLNIGGPAIQAASLSQRLGPFGYDTLLVHGRLSPGEGDMRYLLAPDFTAEPVPTLGRAVAPLQDVRGLWQIYRALCRFRPDIVHTHTAKAGAVGRLAAIAYNHTLGRRKPARLVHTYHGHVFDGYFGSASTSVFIAIERWLAQRTDAIVAISPRLGDDLVETYRIARSGQVRVIPLGFDLSPFAAVDENARDRARVALGIPRDRTVVTTVGRLTEIKQHDLFIEMAALLARERPDVEFLVAGDGELRERLEAAAATHGLKDRVRFLGWRTDLTTIYGATDVFVLTSRNEGTPVALIEAMASGVVGVSTEVGGVSDVILSPETGTLAPFGSPEALASAVLELLTSPSRRRAMGQRAREAVLSRFHVDRLLRDVAGLYDQLLDDEQPAVIGKRRGSDPVDRGVNGGARAPEAHATESSLTHGPLPDETKASAIAETGKHLTGSAWATESSLAPETGAPYFRDVGIRPRARTTKGWRGRLRSAAWLPVILVFLIYVFSGRSDSDLRAAVSAQLAVDAATTGLDLQVEVDRRVVHLSGETTTRAEQDRAIERARSVAGVKSVLSDMRLSDTAIARAVSQMLASDPVVGHIKIDVDSRRGMVRLTSDSTNRIERERAVALAKQVDGVNGVEDRMR